MYKRVGIDPTKTRPSSEALLRRVRKGEPLPRINSLVDICNWCSLEFQLPSGCTTPIASRATSSCASAAQGESYPGIRKDDVHVGGRITLADGAGRSATDVGFRAHDGDDGDDARAARRVRAARLSAVPRLVRECSTLTAGSAWREFTGVPRSRLGSCSNGGPALQAPLSAATGAAFDR